MNISEDNSSSFTRDGGGGVRRLLKQLGIRR